MAVAFLTVDDVPSPLFEEKLAFLREASVPAVFFCIGRNVAGNEDALVRALDLGFELGNHSWTHPKFSELGIEECEREIERADEAIGAIYRLAGRHWPRKLFRFPYFDYGRPELREAIQERLRALGYEAPAAQREDASLAGGSSPRSGRADTGCGFDQKEYWLGKPDAPEGLDRAEVILARISDERPRDGDIILIHDHDFSHGLFFECVESYLSHGIELAALP